MNKTYNFDYIVDGFPVSFWNVKNVQEMREWVATKSAFRSYRFHPLLMDSLAEEHMSELIRLKLERLNSGTEIINLRPTSGPDAPPLKPPSGNLFSKR